VVVVIGAQVMLHLGDVLVLLVAQGAVEGACRIGELLAERLDLEAALLRNGGKMAKREKEEEGVG